MLEGFAPSHPSSWTAQDLVEAGTASNLPYTPSSILPSANAELASRTWLPIGSSDGGRSLRKAADQTPANLSISLDFLQQAEDDLETEEDLRRGRPGPRQIRAYSHLTHLSSNQNSQQQNRSSFGESPETDSPFGSEQEWRRSLAAETDPVYKTGHRSSSRDPPGLSRRTGPSAPPPASTNGYRSHLLSGISPPSLFESSSPSSLSSFGGRVGADSVERSSSAFHDRPASVTRSHSYQTADPQISHSPLRQQAGISIHPSSDGQRLSRLQAEHKSNLTRSLSHERAQGSPSPLHRSLSVHNNSTSTNNNHHNSTSINTNTMSTSPDRNRPPLQSSHSGLPTMHEEAGHGEGEHFASLGSRGQSDLRSNARHRSTSSAAALQHDERNSLAGGIRTGAADPFHRSVSLWRGEMGGMSPGTYSARAFSQEAHQAAFGSQQSPPTVFSSPPSQWDRGRRPDYGGAAAPSSSFDAFADDDLLRASMPGAGTESRRHTIAAGNQGGNGDDAVPSGQRRAIGFEVSRPAPSSAASRTSSVGRQAATPRASAPLPGGLFSGGGLAITEDELTTDLQSLRLNLDDVALQRQQQQQMHEDRRRHSGMRVPSSAAAISGIHASSVPSGFGAPDFANFGQSPPMGGGAAGRLGGQWPVSARLGDEDSSSTWSDLHPSPSNKSTFTEYSQGFQQTSQQPPPHHMSRSPGQGGEDRKTSLSASAKAFAAPFGAVHGSQVSSRQASRDMAPSGFGPSSSPSAQVKQIGGQPLQQQHSSSSRSKSSTSPSMSAAVLSETAIASLITLGPLAPASGGGGGGPPSEAAGSLQELGKGVPLQMLPRSTTLYVVEFKEGRTDLYFRQPQGSAVTEEIHQGDLVIVEADRGKDLGTVVNQSITVEQVQTFLAQQAELAAQQAAAAAASTNPAAAIDQQQQPHPAAVSLSRLSRSMNPKRLFAKAGPADTSLLHSKAQDEERALTLCTTKVNQRGLPMTVVAAELQWDRRKLTFYYTATQRVDFRDLVKELFRLYKTRIWMCHLSHPSGSGLPA